MTGLSLEELITNLSEAKNFANIIRVSDVLVYFGWVKSRKEAVRMIQQKSVKLGNKVIDHDFYLAFIDEGVIGMKTVDGILNIITFGDE